MRGRPLEVALSGSPVSDHAAPDRGGDEDRRPPRTVREQHDRCDPTGNCGASPPRGWKPFTGLATNTEQRALPHSLPLFGLWLSPGATSGALREYSRALAEPSVIWLGLARGLGRRQRLRLVIVDAHTDVLLELVVREAQQPPFELVLRPGHDGVFERYWLPRLEAGKVAIQICPL